LAQDAAGSIDAPHVEAAAADPRRPWLVRYRIAIAAVAFVAWIAITTSNPFGVHASSGFVGALTEGPQWGILFAGLFLVVLASLCRWSDLGLNPPASARSLLTLWLPGVYLAIFAALDVAVGPPPLAVVGFLLLNTVLGGFSEEMMFRGVLFGALRTRLRLAPSVIISTVLFGLAHLLNAAAFGSLPIAGAQAVAATMSGFVFIAIRLRTGSLLPAIAYHALWDFASLMAIARLLGANAGTASGAAGLAAAGAPSPAMLAAPIILLLPNFLYALFLLRPRRLREAAA
jgi:hypothetical protein